MNKSIRATIVSAVLAGAISSLAFGAQVLVWRNIPPLTEVSLSLAFAPHYALRHSVGLFVIVFMVAVAWQLFRDLRQRLVGRNEVHTMHK